MARSVNLLMDQLTDAAQAALNRVLSATRADIPECVGVGLVNMHSGALIGQQAVDPVSGEALDLAAAAAGELFAGRDVLAVENTFNRLRGNGHSGHAAASAFAAAGSVAVPATSASPRGAHAAETSEAATDRFREVIILSGELLHIFQRGKRDERLALVVLSRVTANLSLVLTMARRVVEVVEDIALGGVGR